jgi:hypothetical protein
VRDLVQFVSATSETQKRRTGMPNLSFTAGSISQNVSLLGIISPRSDMEMVAPDALRTACFSDAPQTRGSAAAGGMPNRPPSSK